MRARKTENGWRIGGFLIAKAEEKARWGQRQKWCMFRPNDEGEPVGAVARFNSKSEALEFYGAIAEEVQAGATPV